MAGLVLLLGGAAGVGKSTVAGLWAERRARGVHIELDAVRDLIRGGRVDPQSVGERQAEQYELSVRASCTLAGVCAAAGYDVVVDDVLEPGAFETYWRRRLEGLNWTVRNLLPTLEVTLRRQGGRSKLVAERIVRVQHPRCCEWPVDRRVDTRHLTPAESLAELERSLGF